MPKKESVHEKASILKDGVLSASDGIISTFAVVAGSKGATLGLEVILVIGLANLFADGISMASGNYIGIKSQNEYEENSKLKFKQKASMLKHTMASFIPFVIAGSLPLIPYFLQVPYPFYASIVMVIISLAIVGLIRSAFTQKPPLKSAFESVIIGGFAASVAFLVGYVVDNYIIY